MSRPDITWYCGECGYQRGEQHTCPPDEGETIASLVDERRQLAALRAQLGKVTHQRLGCGRSTLEAAIDGGQVTCQSAAAIRVGLGRLLCR